MTKLYPKKYEVGMAIQNIFDVRWRETRFDTESRLRNEPVPVTEIHFTAGMPLFIKFNFAYLFK